MAGSSIFALRLLHSAGYSVLFAERFTTWVLYPNSFRCMQKISQISNELSREQDEIMWRHTGRSWRCRRISTAQSLLALLALMHSSLSSQFLHYESDVAKHYACATSPLPRNEECSDRAAWSQEGGDSHVTFRAADVSRHLPLGSVLELAWKSSQIVRTGIKIGYDGTIYASDNKLYAFSPEDGTVRATFAVPTYNIRNAFVVDKNGDIFAPTAHAVGGGNVCKLLVFWGHNGTVRSEQDCATNVYDSEPLLSELGYLYLPSSERDRAVSVINTTTLEHVCNMNTSISHGRRAVLLRNDTLVVTDGDVALRAFDAKTCKSLWVVATGLSDPQPIADDFGNLLYPEDGYIIVSLNASDGSELWRTPLNATCNISRTALAVNLTAVVRCGGAHLYGISQVNGSILWHAHNEDLVTNNPDWNNIAVSSNNTAFVSGKNGVLYGFDAATGAVVHRVEIDAYDSDSRVVIGVDGTIYTTIRTAQTGSDMRIYAHEFRYDCRHGASYPRGCFSGLKRTSGALAREWISPRNGIDCRGSPSFLRDGGVVEACSQYLFRFSSNGTEQAAVDVHGEGGTCSACGSNHLSAYVSPENLVYMGDGVLSNEEARVNVWNAPTLSLKYTSSAAICQIQGLPLVVNSTSYVGSMNGRVYKYAVQGSSLSRTVIFVSDPSIEDTTCSKTGFGLGVFGGYQDIAYAPLTNGTLVSITLSGSLRWTVFLGSGFISGLAVDAVSNTAFLVANATKLLAVGTSGNLVWTTMVGEASEHAPLLAKDHLYAGLKNGTFLAVHKSSGIVLWSSNLGSSASDAPLLDSQGRLFVPLRNGNLAMVDALSGKALAFSLIGSNAAVPGSIALPTPTISEQGRVFSVHNPPGGVSFGGFTFCPPGRVASNLQCVPCPAGTYRIDEQECTLCNSAAQFCPLGNVEPIPLPPLLKDKTNIQSRYTSPRAFSFSIHPLVSNLNNCNIVYSYAVVAAIVALLSVGVLAARGMHRELGWWKENMFGMAVRMDQVRFPSSAHSSRMQNAKLVVRRWTPAGFLATIFLLCGGLLFTSGVVLFSMVCNKEVSTSFVPQQVTTGNTDATPSFSMKLLYEIGFVRQEIDPCVVSRFAFEQDIFTQASDVSFSVSRGENLNNATGVCRLEIVCEFPCRIDAFSPHDCIQVGIPFSRTYGGRQFSGMVFLRTSYVIKSSQGEEKISGDLIEYGPDIEAHLYNQQEMQVQEQEVDDRLDPSQSFTSIRLDLQARGSTGVGAACFSGPPSAILLKFSATQRENKVVEAKFSYYTLFAIAVSTLSTAYTLLAYGVKYVNSKEPQYRVLLSDVEKADSVTCASSDSVEMSELRADTASDMKQLTPTT